MVFFNPLNPVNMKPATPEGHAGPYAHVFLPFYGFWFPSGQQYSFNTGEIRQRASRPLNGLTRPDSFQKDCCGCGASQTAVI